MFPNGNILEDYERFGGELSSSQDYPVYEGNPQTEWPHPYRQDPNTMRSRLLTNVDSFPWSQTLRSESLSLDFAGYSQRRYSESSIRGGDWSTQTSPEGAPWSSISDPTTYSSWNDTLPPFEISDDIKPDISQLSDSCSSRSKSATPVPASRRPSKKSKSAQSGQTDVKKECSHCHATSTPLWRREPGTLKPLCNACGLYLQQRNKLRPQELIDADLDNEEDDSSKIEGGPECSHCHTRNTSVWRRSPSGAQLCNACGVYRRLRGRDRPLSLKRNKIKPRSKHTK